MPEEEYTIRIRPNGEILIEAEGLTPQQIRDLAGYLVETMGPVRIEAGDGDAGGMVEITLDDLAGRGIEEEDAVRERLRLREGQAPPGPESPG